MMIIVQLQGGLGNQMFQYAAGKALSVKYNFPLYLDHSFLERNTQSYGHFIARKYELGIFNLSSNRISNNIIDQYLDAGSDRKMYFYKEQPVTYDLGFKKIKPPVYLAGYWQSYKYFDNIEELIKADFSITENVLVKNASNVIEKIKASNSISIHLRRCDYIAPPNTINLYHTCSIEYYKKGIDLICKQFPNAHLFVFSDDINWAEENMKSLSIPVNFSQRVIEADWLDLYLMSLCKHNIIANSTFSWWAAWLNSNNNKMVIAPKKWFNMERSGFNLGYLCPKEWLKIS